MWQWRLRFVSHDPTLRALQICLLLLMPYAITLHSMSAYGDTIKYIKAINTEYFHAVIFLRATNYAR